MAKGKKGWMKWLVIAVLVAAGVVYWMQTSQKGTPVLTATAATADIRAWVEERAKTTLPRVYKLTMPVAGRIKPIEREAGQQVKKGELLASMDTTPLLAAKAEAQAKLDVNTFNALEKTAAQEFQRWIEAVSKTADAAREMTKASDAQLQFSEWYTKSVDELVKKGATPRERALRAKAENAQYEVNAAVNRLVAQAMETIRIASQLGPRYVQEWLKRKSLETDALKQSLAKAENDLERASLHSPIDGVILARHVKNETVLPAGAPLLDIGDLSELQVTADILTQNAGPIQPGQEVDILGQVFGKSPVKGTVQRVKPEAFTKVSSLGVEQQRVPVIVGFSDDIPHKQALGLGYRLRVRIYTDQATGAVVVPRLSLFRDNKGQWLLYAVDGGMAALRTVEVGLMNDEQAQVLSGLASGEEVIVSPPKGLKDGDQVTGQPL